MDVVAIVPARGGSKGIEKKNIVPFLGSPLITHTIEQARRSESIDNVFVSTDAADIAEVGREAGATIINRPNRIAGDEASTESALLHALSMLREDGRDPDVLVLLQCTSPLRRSGDIDATVGLVTKQDYNSALSCCEDHKFYWRFEEDSAVPINYDPENRSRRQDMEKRYQENGSIYAFETDVLMDHECRLGGRIGIHEMPESLSFEIDVPEDLDIVTSVAEKTDHELILADDSTTKA